MSVHLFSIFAQTFWTVKSQKTVTPSRVHNVMIFWKLLETVVSGVRSMAHLMNQPDDESDFFAPLTIAEQVDV